MTSTRPKWMQQVRGTGLHRGGNPHDTTPDAENIHITLYRVRRGDPCPLINAPERRAVIVALTEAGWSSRRIAIALGLAQRSVQRHRSRYRTHQAA